MDARRALTIVFAAPSWPARLGIAMALNPPSVGVLGSGGGGHSRSALHDPDAESAPRQDRVLRDAEAEMLVGRHVARDRREELAAHPLRVRARGHVPHQGAAEAPPLLARLDAEPGEIP